MRVGDTVIFQSVKVPAMYVHCDTDVGDDESHSEWAQEHQLDVANEMRPPGAKFRLKIREIWAIFWAYFGVFTDIFGR